MRNYPIYTQHCKHTRLYYMCFSLVFACLSVCLSVSQSVGLGARSQEPCPATHPTYTSLPHPGSTVPNLVGAWQGLGLSIHSGSRGLCVCVCARMYVHGEPVCKYVQRAGSCHRGGRWGCWRQGLPGVARSQVDSPKVSGRCDGVALRAELLGTLQGEQGGLRLCIQCCTFAHVRTWACTNCVLGPWSCQPRLGCMGSL